MGNVSVGGEINTSVRWEIFIVPLHYIIPQVVDYLMSSTSMEKTLTAELLHQAIGVLCINAMGFEKPTSARKRKGRAVFSTLSAASHSCTNNAVYTINPQTFRYAIKGRSWKLIIRFWKLCDLITLWGCNKNQLSFVLDFLWIVI